MFEFKITAKDKETKARVGEFHTPHGKLTTPEIAFVATDGYIKGLPNEILHTLPINFTITNTFHTYIKSLVPEIEKEGGINKYMKSNHVTATDSGGFQVFSLGFGKVHGVGKISSIFPEENRKEMGLIITRDRDNLLVINEEGVMFPYDKKFVFFTPEISIDIQERLGADITFAFDECTSPLNSHEYTKQAMERTHRWLTRCLKQKKRTDQALFAVVQGGYFRDLRTISAKFCAKQDVSGFGIGGSLGRNKKDLNNVIGWVNAILPEDKPRHLFGIGQVRDIFEAVERGVDLFDCVIPTREARHKVLYTKHGRINIRKYTNENIILEKGCKCIACQEKLTYRQLIQMFHLKDPRAFLFSTIHNIQFYSDLMKGLQDAIYRNRLTKLKNTFFKFY
ncbi:hypothetical protein A3C28_01790 [Candidatus Roizmanbacteria bacterium RIFCSPHIGHO2_02_FULL_39_9]|uniref:tRNA-guanine(15) transglycosylase-like domain-containing protein n=2 Tax=Candidatus Roizmaniibacteriota TaxID=1752723 RepID=A0A1F7HWQ0_9BACT|nr:MAG: hypothetical protein A3C28_01790 [Candidatus Roizmanbacteria bacterium RIFCSPHIGHO2_02_FULL_39_9]OGK35568.1 MAG: hypothetical protein A3F60_04035 [Candidatus Roizmanbacteria bacterium RIFCSPHIGHO2_12_FULL_39_8]